ncbi:hypothetical protein OG478_23005 [Streptomyces phaeochromogenes]|uniref:hypothetical protein n=1 Tax=Streptomyces phaeochromogenes TaxID=1923 RepID=UPI003867CCEE|nr:hypothetical protein OG478_23005 [Streptomyces phaeochromogenes]
MSPLRILRQLVAPTGQHRGTRAGSLPALIEVPIDSLLRPQLPGFPEAPAHGAIAPQAFRHCLPCGGDVAVVLHGNGTHSCDEGHFTITRSADQ